MILKSRNVFLFLLATLASTQKLTEEENAVRKQKCGQNVPRQRANEEGPILPQGLVQKAFEPEPNSWLVRVQLLDPQGKMHPDFALGSLISPRHVLTSSQMLMNDNDEWFWNDEVLKPEDFLNGTRNVPLPLDNTGGFKLKVRVRSGDGEYKVHSVKRAWLINVPAVDKYEYRSMMLAELTENVQDIQYPCLMREGETVGMSHQVYIFGLHPNRNYDLVLPRFKSVTYYSDTWIGVRSYVVQLDRGGPMLEGRNERVTIVGVAATPAWRSDDVDTYFFNVQEARKAICEFGGVCDDVFTKITTTTT